MNHQKTLSIIIPVYNEEKTVTVLLDLVAKVQLPLNKEIIIVNDGSSDNTGDVIKQWASTANKPDTTVKTFDKTNGGKGSAVRHGIENSTGDIVIIQDADLEYDPEDYLQCIEPILNGEAQVVYGSRQLKSRKDHSYTSFYLGGLLVTNWMNFLFGAELTDEPTCYKTFDGDLIRALSFEGDRFEWEPEITAKLLRLGYEIKEASVNYNPRRIEEGKKINWKDGIQALWTTLIWRFRPIKKEKARVASFDHYQENQLGFQKRRNWVLGIIVLCFILRMGLALCGFTKGQEHFCRPDSSSYINPALSLYYHGSFNTGLESTTPETLRTPGFPLLLSCFYVIHSPETFKFQIIIFCLISALTCLPVYLSGKHFGGTAIGITAMLLFGLNISSIANAPMFLTDTLFTFAVAWQLYFFIRFYFSTQVLYLLISVCIAGAASLIRPVNMLWLFPALFLIMIFREFSLKKRLASAGLTLLAFCLFTIPWMTRNYLHDAGFTLSNLKGEFLYHNGAVLESFITGETAESIRRRMHREVALEFKTHPEKYATIAQKVDYKTGLFMDKVKEHPLRYASLHFRPQILIPDAPSFFEIMGLTSSGRGTFDVLNRQGIIAAVKHYFNGRIWPVFAVFPLLAIVGITYLACGIELLKWLWQRQWFMIFVFLAFVEYYFFMPGPITMPRYQLPALPLMCIMAAVIIITIVKKLQVRLSPKPS